MPQTTPRGKTKESIALAAFFKIAEKWELTNKEQMILLGLENASTIQNYRRDPTSARVDKDMLERLSLILGIFKDLQILLSDVTAANAWIKKNNEAEPFCGRSALEFLLEKGRIIDLYRVRHYLAAQRGV